MIEILDPAADRPRIESLLDSATGISLVNAWEAALPELASLDLPHLSPGSADAQASLDEYARRERDWESQPFLIFLLNVAQTLDGGYSLPSKRRGMKHTMAVAQRGQT